MSLMVRALVFGSLMGLTSQVSQAQVRHPVGYFVIQAVGSQNVKDVKLNAPAWNGIVIRERWSNVAPLP